MFCVFQKQDPQPTPVKPVVKKENQWFDVGIVKVTNMVVTHFYMPADDSQGDVSVSPDLFLIPLSAVMCALNQKSSLIPGRLRCDARLQSDEEDGAPAWNSLQVPSCRDQRLWSWSLFRDIRFQDLPPGLPRGAVCH